MKKQGLKITGILTVVILLLQSFAFSETYEGAEKGFFKEIDLGDVKIGYTERMGMGLRNSYHYYNCTVVDKDGNYLVDPIYSEILPPTEGRAAFRLEGKVGFFDENWNVVIEPVYSTNRFPFDVQFSEGLAAVFKDSGWGYIDRDGNTVIDFVYDSAESFENGVARVGIEEDVYNYTKTKYGAIDKNGSIVEPFKFSYYAGNDYQWQNDTLDVLLSENLVEINGRRYENKDLEYPFINYLGLSYIPLTYYGCRILGINCDWTAEDGVMLVGGGEALEDITGDNGMQSGVYDKAEIYKGRLSVNGKVYEYGDTSYPLISYKNVVYMPVLWQTGMEALGIEYSFLRDDQVGGDRGCMVFNLQKSLT